MHHEDGRCAMERAVGGCQVALLTCPLIQTTWLIQSGLELIEVWGLDWGQKMLGVHMAWLIAYNSALKDLLHVVLLRNNWHLIDFRGNIFNVPLFALLLHSWLSCLNVKRSCLLISSTKPSWSILLAATLTWRNNHYLLSKHRIHLFLIAEQLLLIVVIRVRLSLKFLW